MTIYSRFQLLSRARELLEIFPVLGIVGPRQVGKTTLAKMIVSDLKINSIYIDLENEEDFNSINTEPTILLNSYKDHCVVIDEIQRMPRLFPIIRSLIDQDRKPARFIILGSASPSLIKDSSESLAGRVGYLNTDPFNINELPEGISIQQHWLRGGFPEALFSKDERKCFIWLDNFIRTYAERDLPILGFPADPLQTFRLWKMLASVHGGLANYNNISNSLGIQSSTLKRYLRFLEEAFLIFTLPPFSANIKKRIVKSPKIYIKDTGILHKLLNINTLKSLQSHIVLGTSWESYVIEQIMSVLGNSFEFYFVKTHQGSEADLVITNGGIPIISVEIKYGTTPKLSKGFVLSTEMLKTKENFIIASVNNAFPVHKNITVVNLPDFIQNRLPKILEL